MKFLTKVFLFAIILVNLLWSSQLKKLDEEIKNLYSDVSPSVVSIHYGSSNYSDCVGTGVVIDNKGHIVTIKRFIENDSMWVETDNGNKLSAVLLGADSKTSITVLKVKSALRPAQLCNPNNLSIGDLLFVIGNSFGLKNGISLSIFSGRRGDEDFLQLGNSALPGNSGAGVFNSSGELVGIVSFALHSPILYKIPEIKSPMKKQLKIKISSPLLEQGDMAGPGVVIPQDRVMELAREIIEKGKIERGWLGLFLEEEDGKIIVKDIVKDSPAEKAKIKKGDIILNFNGEDVKNLKDFIKIVKKTKPETGVSILVKRNDRKKKLHVKIGERPEGKKLFRVKKIIRNEDLFDKEELDEFDKE